MHQLEIAAQTPNRQTPKRTEKEIAVAQDVSAMSATLTCQSNTMNVHTVDPLEGKLASVATQANHVCLHASLSQGFRLPLRTRVRQVIRIQHHGDSPRRERRLFSDAVW